jgi:hypothetical protein
VGGMTPNGDFFAENPGALWQLHRSRNPGQTGCRHQITAGFPALIFRAFGWGVDFRPQRLEDPARPSPAMRLAARSLGARNPDAATGGKADDRMRQEGES